MSRVFSEFALWLKRTLRIWLVVGAILSGTLGVIAWLQPSLYSAEAELILPFYDTRRMEPESIMGPSPIEIIRGVATSRKLKRALAKRLDRSVEDIDESLSSVSSPKSNILTLGLISEGPQKAVQDMEVFLEILDQTLSTVTLSQADQQAKELGKSVARLDQEILDKQDLVITFQESMNVAPEGSGDSLGATFLAQARNLELKLDTVNDRIAALKSAGSSAVDTGANQVSPIESIELARQALQAKRLELRNALIDLGDEAPDVTRLKEEVAILETNLKEEAASYSRALNSSATPQLVSLEAERLVIMGELETAKRLAEIAPKEQAKLQRLLADLDTTAKAAAGIRQQYEDAMIRSRTSIVRYSVLTPPYLEQEAPTNKSLSRLGLSSILLSSVLTLVIASVAFLIGRRRQPVL